MIENKEFNNYIEQFKKMPIKTKKALTIEEMKKLLAFIEKIKKDFNINNEILFNREILDVAEKEKTEDDFVEAIFVYICSIEESLASYVDYIMNLLYK